MLRTLFFFLKLAVLLAVAVWLAGQPGQVSLVWLGWRVDTSVGILLAAVLVLAVIVALIYRLWRFLVRSPAEIARSRHEKRRRQGYRALTQGMVALAAGDAIEAERQSKKADILLNEPPLTLLLAAQAAQLNGDEAAATRYFEAMLARPETSFLGVRGLLMQAMRGGDDRAALGYAGRALAERPNTPWAAEALLDLQLRAGQWQAAAATLKQARKLKVVDDARAHRIRAVMLTEEARVEATTRATLDRYASLFNARDWDGVRALVSDDCRLDLVSKSQRRGKQVGAYFARYEKEDVALRVGRLEGRLACAAYAKGSAAGADRPAYFILLELEAGLVAAIRDFRYVPYISAEADFEILA